MNFNVPMRTTGMLNSQTLAQQQGNIKSSIRLQHATNQDFMPNLAQSSQQNYDTNFNSQPPMRQTPTQQNYYVNPTPQPPMQQTPPQQNYYVNSSPQPPMQQTIPQQNYYANSSSQSPMQQTPPQQNYYANSSPQPPMQQTIPQQTYYANSSPQSPMRQTPPQQNYYGNSAPQSPMRTAPQNSTTGMYLRKGQKIPITESYIKIALGWEVLNSQCELDASAFLLNQNQIVLNDDWFVFYGQPSSPDRTVQYSVNQNGQDKALIDVQIANLRPDIQKIVFAVTIYEAFERRLNFGMTKNVYGRILNNRNQEIARFDLTDCYHNVTAMVIGELYRYQNTWKFNAVGSGVARDLPAFCGMYGVNFER